MKECNICYEKRRQLIQQDCCSITICKQCCIQISTLCPICDRQQLHKKNFKCTRCFRSLNHLERKHDDIDWNDYCKDCFAILRSKT